MRRLPSIAIIVVFLLFAARLLSAQTPPQTNWRWNEFYGVEAIEKDYQSLPNDGQTKYIQGSDNARYDSPTFQFKVDFSENFSILGEEFFPAQNTVYIQASVAGFFKFTTNPATIQPLSSTSYYLQPVTAGLNRLIMPYWGKLRGRQGGGIFYRFFDNSPAISGPDSLVIEWRVEQDDPNGGVSGSFQAHVALRPTHTSRHYLAIEFHYDLTDPNSLSWQQPLSISDVMRGAAVGLKNRGQQDQFDTQYGIYWNQPDYHNYGPGLDDGNSLIIARDIAPSGDPVAQTRVPVFTQNASSPPVPEWNGWLAYNFNAVPSNIFHYSFPALPTKGYRVKPVENDILVGDVRIRTFVVTDTTKPYYRGGTAGVPRASYTNHGPMSITDLHVTATIHKDNLLILESTAIIPVIESGETIIVDFPDTVNDGGGLAPGRYTLCAYHDYPPDDDRSNDTACRYFFIRDLVDIAPVEIVGPVLTSPPNLATYELNSTVGIVGKFINYGDDEVVDVPVGCMILDAAGNVVYSALNTIGDPWPVDEERAWTFPTWSPGVPGIYYVTIFSAFPGDSIPTNDTIYSIPIASPIWWRYPGHEFHTLRIPFEVLPSYDVGMESVPLHPHSPIDGSLVTEEQVEVKALIRNHGREDATDVRVQLEIHELSPTTPETIHKEDIVVPIIPSRSVQEVAFAPVQNARLASGGPYYAVITTRLEGDDNSRDNSMVIQFSTAYAKRVAGSDTTGREMAIVPNPASDDVQITFDLPRKGPFHLDIHDMYGTHVRESAGRGEAGQNSIRMQLRGLPSGIYTTILQSAGGTRIVRKFIIVQR